MTSNPKNLRHLVIWLAAATPLGACSSSDGQVDPSTAVAAAELSEAQSGVMPDALLPKVFPIPLDGAAPTSPEQAAQQVAESVGSAFEPAGCATASVEGAAVTYTLNGCKPSRGMGRALHADHGRGRRHAMNATFTLTFSSTATGFAIAIEGSNVSGCQSQSEITGNATLDFEGTRRVLAVQTEGVGTGHGGESLLRTASHTRSYDSATDCFTLDGAWSMDGPHGKKERSVSGYVQCGDSCPKAGTVVGEGMMRRHGGGHRGRHGGHGDMAGSGPGGGEGAGNQPSDVGRDGDVTVTLEFDGSAEAAWSASNGQSGTLPLSCTAAE